MSKSTVLTSCLQPVTTAEDADFMADLLGEVDTNIVSHRPILSKKVKTGNRRKVRVLSPPIEVAPTSKGRKNGSDHSLKTPPAENNSDEDEGYLPPIGNDDTIMSDPIPSSPTVKAVERKEQATIKAEEDDEEDTMEISQAVGDHNIKASKINISGARPVPKILKKSSYPTPESSSPTRPPVNAIDPSTWNDVTAKLNVLSSPAQSTAAPGKIRPEHVMEEDGSIRFFWIDYTEVNGSLCLFGKAKDKTTGSFTSAFVKVDNILRKLFFLPREYKQREF